MKRILFCAVVLIMSATACKKDPSQLSFSLENLTRLINRSQDYIKHASPGDIYITEDEYLVFKLLNEIDGMSIAYLYYGFEDSKSSYIDIIPNQVDNLDYAKLFMTLSEDEIGTASLYYLKYLDDNSESQTETFSTMTELWAFVSSESLTASEIEDVTGYYLYGDYIILAGGYYYIGTSDSYFQPVLEVAEYSSLTSGINSRDLIKEAFSKGLNFKLAK
jgi:hypothetical protein